MTFADDMLTDLDNIMNADEFGIAAVVDGDAVTGIFDNNYVEIEGVSGTYPVLTCKTSDVSGAAQGDVVTVNSTSYRIASVQPDGTGVTQLVLEETA